jgi:hypothetical protein
MHFLVAFYGTLGLSVFLYVHFKDDINEFLFPVHKK